MKFVSTHRPNQLNWILGLFVVMFMTLMPAERSQAQLSAVAQAMEPEYFTRDLLIFIEGLDLDETQAVIAEAIFDDYEMQFDAGKLLMEQEIEALTNEIKAMKGQGQQDKILEMVVMPIQDWLVRREELNSQLIENVKIILIPEQQELWTAFNRRLYREKKLDDGKFSGERVDLFIIARDTNVDSQIEPAKQIMDDYAMQLDQALHARQRLIEGEDTSLLDSLQNRTNNPSVDIDVKKKIIEHRIKVRNINDLYREEIAAVLDPEKADAFRTETLRRAYPKIYRTTNAERVFDEALATYDPAGGGEGPGPKADKQTYDAIWSLYGEFLGQMALINDKLYAITRSSEPETQRARLENQIRRSNGEQVERPQNPLTELQQEKRELESEYLKRLRDLLGDDAFFELNGTRRYDDRSYVSPEGDGNKETILKLTNPGGQATKRGTKEKKPDKRPDAPKNLGNGAGIDRPGNSQDD
ncbi:MAG: hypothetical protein CMJ40_01660 [Phycisphaerae bacterium]|nr:hypothetical protein [Phycisphaerae bacterium]